VGALSLLIDERFKGPVLPIENPEISSVGTTSTTVFRASDDRLAFIIVNLSGAAMFARPRLVASSSAGFRLGPNGGFIRLLWDEDFLLVGLEWNIIADAAASNLYSVEYRRR